MRIVKIGVLVPALLVITLSPLLSAPERGAGPRSPHTESAGRFARA
jgi:hypothetical protein